MQSPLSKRGRCPGAARPATVLPLVCFTSSLLVLACVGRTPQVDGDTLFNFHVLDPGRAYRSAQPDAAGLRNVINQLGIRTVINLRGENTGEYWYDAEKRVTDEMGVTLSNHRMSASALPPPEVLAGVIEALQTVEYPILIHCESGADRTGAVAAIYRMLILGDSKAEALQELTPLTLHFRQIYPCVDTLAEAYEPDPDWIDWYAENHETMTCQ